VVAKLVALVLPLGLDTFAVAAALGSTGAAREQRTRIALLFTAFEAGMPLVGFALGAPLGRAIGVAADYLAIAVLIAFGTYTLVSSDEDEEERLRELSRLHGPAALLLGLSISLDELAIGFTFGLLKLPVVLAIVLIAVQAFVLTQLGLRLGHRLSESLREGAERLAGAALITLGVVLLVERAVP
jgi:manganese efflux pump family protein